MIHYNCEIENPAHQLKSESQTGNFCCTSIHSVSQRNFVQSVSKLITDVLLARNAPPLPTHNKPLQNHLHPTSPHLPLTTPANPSRHNNIPRSRLPPPQSPLLVSQSGLLPPPALAQTPLLFPSPRYPLRITCPRKPPLPTETQLHPLRSRDEELFGQEIRTS
jgi:hypothetical protein